MPQNEAPAPRLAKLFDGMADGQPVIANRPTLTGSNERARILAYLDQGHLITRSNHLDIDRLDPARGSVVPTIFLSDGAWLWSAANSYYLREHELVPEHDFLEYLRSRDYTFRTPTKAELTRAAKALRDRAASRS
jgi:hypothetical protein